MLSMIALRGFQEAVDPRKQLFCTVISVKNDRNSVKLSHGTNVKCSRDGTSYGSSVVLVVEAFSSIELQKIIRTQCYVIKLDSNATATGNVLEIL